MADLTDEAKAEIAEAIRIVREDKNHSMLRDIHSRTTPKPDPSPTEPTNPAPASAPPASQGDPPKDPAVVPPPANDPPPPAAKKGLWWGDRTEGN
jgi:hypothetical protein